MRRRYYPSPPAPAPFFFFAIITVIAISNHPTLTLSYPDQGDQSFRTMIINATSFPPEGRFDYVVVGGGTAGCPLAATLSRGFRVLVLERGGSPYTDPAVMNQDGFLATLAAAALDSPAQSFASEDGVPNARGRVLGGSSAINAGFYTRGDEEFYARSGVEWDRRLVNESYEWVESKIVFRPELNSWQLGFREGLLQAGVGPYNGFTLDHVLGTKIGGSIFDRFGKRHSAADLLFYSRPTNLKVVVYATVERILISEQFFPGGGMRKRATGVVFRDKAGRRHNAMVVDGGEVLLTAGAMGSPQLLLLSGIGPPGYLSSWRIPVVHDLPEVGKFFFDNPRNSISIAMPPVPLKEHSLIQVVGISPSGAYIEAASNMVPMFAPIGFIGAQSPPLFLSVATIMSKINGPLSVGTFRLVSTNVRVSPVVRFNYFRHPIDMAKCVNGTRTIGKVLRSPAMDRFKFGSRDFQFVGPVLPEDLSNYALMEDFCRRTVSSIWHYHGGCLVGKVVDADYRVFGIDSLRVIDGSTFPISPGTNPQATVMMLGRYVGVKIGRARIGYTL